jgi:CheY-like chemotaxis protein
MSGASRNPTRLLLVEDHLDLANATADFLREWGLEVQIAGSGEQALEMAAAFSPQIVLSDLTLPDISGLEVIRRLRADPKTRNASFVVYTAMSPVDIDALEEASAGEVDLFLSKPLTDSAVNDFLGRFAARGNQT